MRLVVDTSVLVAELLRAAGRQRLGDDRLELFLPEWMWREVHRSLPRRVGQFARRRELEDAVRDELTRLALDAIDRNVVVVDAAVYAALEEEATARSVRDPTDWPVVATALVLGAAIWTNDNDFLGTGVATWTTETLQAWLDRNKAS